MRITFLYRLNFACILAVITLLYGAVFTHELRSSSKKRYLLTQAAGFAGLLLIRFLFSGRIHADDTVASIFVEELLNAVVLVFIAKRSSNISWPGAIYLGSWGIITYNVAREVFEVLQYFPAFGNQPEMVVITICEIGQLLLLIPAWRFLPKKIAPDRHLSVGPRQTTSAVSIAIMFLLGFSFLHNVNSVRELEPSLIIIFVLLQIYSVTLLYLQVDLFRKSAMQKELDTVQVMIEKQKQQYVIAKQNIQIINRRCHDLKQIIYKLQQGEVNEETLKIFREAEEAANIYDAVVKTGNDVLDTVLTDKSLLCDAEQIRISCVADGKVLSFMEAADIYTIFDEALDYGIAEVRNFNEHQQRFMDVIIHQKGNFAIINIMFPMFQAREFKNGLPVSKGKKDDGTIRLKMIREILRRYDGLCNVEIKNGMMTLRIVIPQL